MKIVHTTRKKVQFETTTETIPCCNYMRDLYKTLYGDLRIFLALKCRGITTKMRFSPFCGAKIEELHTGEF